MKQTPSLMYSAPALSNGEMLVCQDDIQCGEYGPVVRPNLLVVLVQDAVNPRVIEEIGLIDQPRSKGVINKVAQHSVEPGMPWPHIV